MAYESVKTYRINLRPQGSGKDIRISVRVDERDLSNAKAVFLSPMHIDNVMSLLSLPFNHEKAGIDRIREMLEAGESVDTSVIGVYSDLIRAEFIRGWKMQWSMKDETMNESIYIPRADPPETLLYCEEGNKELKQVRLFYADGGLSNVVEVGSALLKKIVFLCVVDLATAKRGMTGLGYHFVRITDVFCIEKMLDLKRLP
jgi:hypothetical protein